MIDKDKLQAEMEKDAELEENEGSGEGQEGAAEESDTEEDATGADGEAGNSDDDGGEGEDDGQEAASGEDDDEAEPSAPIPVKAFLKQKAKWKAKVAQAAAAAEKRIQELTEKSQSQGGLSASDLEDYKIHKATVGKLQEAAKKFPWLAAQLYALEQGLEPDWRGVHQTLDAHVKALPSLDPTTAAKMAEQDRILSQLQFRAQKQEFAERKVREDQEIRKLFKDGANERFFSTVNKLTTALVKALPEGAFQLPDRIEIAKELMAMRKADREELLKQQTQVGKTKQGAGTPPMKGAPAASKAKPGKIPPLGTPEYEAFMMAEIEKDLAAN